MTYSEASRNVHRAIARGEYKYIGRDCPKKHGGERYVNQHMCVMCCKERNAEARENAKRNGVIENMESRCD